MPGRPASRVEVGWLSRSQKVSFIMEDTPQSP